MSSDLPIGGPERIILETFEHYEPGDGTPGDGDCGLYALCAALADSGDCGVEGGVDVAPADAFMSDVLDELRLSARPSYTWSDDELAVIADHYGRDTYVFDATDDTGVVFGRGDRPAAVLYNADGDARWTPGVRAPQPVASRAPRRLVVVENVAWSLGLDEIADKVRWHARAAGGRAGLCARIGGAIAAKARGCLAWRGAVLRNVEMVKRRRYKCGCGCGRGRRLWWLRGDGGSGVADDGAAAPADGSEVAGAEAVVMAWLGAAASAAAGGSAVAAGPGVASGSGVDAAAPREPTVEMERDDTASKRVRDEESKV